MNSGVLPRKRKILLEQRLYLERAQEREEQTRLRELQRAARAEKRRAYWRSPLVRTVSSVGSGVWMLLLSLILTLFATYLVRNPAVFESLERSLRFSLQPAVAGAAQTRVSAIKTHQMELVYVAGQEKAPPKSYKVDEDGWQGRIPLVSSKKSPVTQLVSRKVDKVLTISGLPNNDAGLIPVTKSFSVCEVREGKQGTTVKELKAAEYRFEVTARDDDEVPIEYQAIVTYRGLETVLETTHYSVVARYKGTVYKTRNLPKKASTHQLAEEEPLVEEEPEEKPQSVRTAVRPVPVKEDPVTEPEERRSFFPLMAASSGTALGAGGAGVVYFRKRRKGEEEQ